jgi:hypothetical protein
VVPLSFTTAMPFEDEPGYAVAGSG